MLAPAVHEKLDGLIETDITIAGVQSTGALAPAPLKVTVIAVFPVVRHLSRPGVLRNVAIEESDEVMIACDVMSCLKPSLKVTVPVSCTGVIVSDVEKRQALPW
jgi:hypothetical protein